MNLQQRRLLIRRLQVWRRRKNVAGKPPPSDSDPFSDAGVGKNLACLSTNSSRAPVAASSSIKAVSFSSTRTAKRFSSLCCASAIQIVRPLESIKWQMKCVPMSSTIPAHVYCLSHDAVIRIYDAAGNVIPVNVRPPCLTDYSLS